MIATTRDWKVALGCYQVPQRGYLVPENDIKIEYEQIDSTAQSTAEIAVNSAVSWSDHSEVMNLDLDYSRQVPLATLEPNEWVLDGGMNNIGTCGHYGWVSGSLSKADGTFDVNPKITLTWETNRTLNIPGITIWWSSLLNEWAAEFNITAKKNGSNVFSQNFTGSDISEFYQGSISDYDTIIIEITKWCLPYRRVRMENIALGLIRRLNKKEILTAEQGLYSDLLSFTLPDDYFTFEIDNVSEEWNPDNPEGVYAFLAERQRIVVKYAFSIDGEYEWHTVGTYFMSEWTTPQNGITASFTARSLIDFMSKKFAPGSITGYSFGDSISLKALATNAFQQAGLPVNFDGSTKWSIADDLNSINVIIPYTSSEVEGETVNTWMFDFSCAEVIQLCANAGCAVIRPNVNGDICITMPNDTVSDYYIDQFVSFTNGEYDLSKPLKSVNINNGEMIYSPSGADPMGEEQSITNPLLQSTERRTAECAFVSNMLTKRKSVKGDFRADPRLHPLDVITTVNKYAANRVWITECKWIYAGAFKGQYSGRILKTIPLINQSAWWYSGDIYSGGEW